MKLFLSKYVRLHPDLTRPKPKLVLSKISMREVAIGSGVQAQVNRVLADAQSRNESLVDAESDKLDRWANDLKENLERELKNIEREIREAKKGKRLAADLQSKIAAQKLVNELEQRRNQKNLPKQASKSAFAVIHCPESPNRTILRSTHPSHRSLFRKVMCIKDGCFFCASQFAGS